MESIMSEKETKPKRKRAYHKTSETQKIIFNKAMALMSEKGFQGTTVRDICTEADIPIGTFYNCYKSKVDILKPVYDEGDKFFEGIGHQLEGKDAITQLHMFANYYAQLNINTGIDVMRVLFYPTNEWFARTRPMQEFLLNIIKGGQERGELRRDYDADHAVRYIFDILRGVCYNWCIYNGEFDIAERIEEHIALLCGVLKND
jgi:AcrR family transcriptional regulator